MASQAPSPGLPASTVPAPPPAPRGSDRGPGGGRGRLRLVLEALGETTELFAASGPGRTILAVLVLKTVVGLSGGAAAPGWLRVLDAAGTVALVAALGYLLVRVLNLLQQRFLWRVRRKLVLSYVLIGFVPILLFGAFFLVSGWMLLSTVSSSLVQLSFADVMDDANALAAMTSIDLRGRVEPEEVRAVLATRVGAVRERYPGVSVAVAARKQTGPDHLAAAGPWRHASGEPGFPDWLDDDEAEAGGFVLTRGQAGWTIVARGVQTFDADGLAHAVVADLPITDDVTRRMQASRAVTLTDFSVTERADSADATISAPAFDGVRFSFGALPRDAVPTLSLPSAAFVDLLDWSTGEHGERWRGEFSFGVRPALFYRQLARGDDVSFFASAFVGLLMLIGVTFLTIEAVAVVMGFALAKSITGAVHELFTGTERVRDGDFTHRIRVDTEDQLGELAESFNTMTGSIADLMAEAAEKRRLEEELRIARDIQMSLLPEGTASVPGLAVTAACRPAREVGGDYYDFIRLDEHRLGVLVADVSGKGTSAALYMAELKGVVMSLSRFHQSPRELLIEVNRILSSTLDGRTFITMTYAVVDLAARRLTYARAGHTPLVHVPFAAEGPRTPRVLAPDGLVVGLQIDGVEEKFAELLEESTFPIETGDLVALFTDGVTEAMNEESDLFGEERLGRTLTEQIHLSSDDLKQRVLGDVEAFAGAAEQHDDMTIVLLRVGDAPSLPPPASRP